MKSNSKDGEANIPENDNKDEPDSNSPIPSKPKPFPVGGKRKRTPDSKEPKYKKSKVESDVDTVLSELDNGDDLKVPTPEMKLSELLEPIYLLRSQLENVLSKLPKPNNTQQDIWGKLHPQVGPVIPLSGMKFTIGRNPNCNLPILNDSAIKSELCSIHFLGGKAILESSGSGLSLNKRAVRRQIKKPLISGDEITITGNQTYTYTFHLTHKSSNVNRTDCLSDLESLSKALKSVPQSNIAPLLNLLTPENQTDYSKTVTPALTSSSLILPSTTTLDLSSSKITTSTITTTTTTTTTSSLNEKGHVDDFMDTSSHIDITSEYKVQIMNKIESVMLPPELNTITFQNFPYHVEDTLKDLLINSAYLYLQNPSFVKFTKSIPNMSRRILLSGQKGTQIFQEKLAQSLAKHFNAKFLILDDCFQNSQKSDSPSDSTITEDPAPSFDNDSTTRTFKKGDTVKYVGNTQSSYSSSSILRQTHPKTTEDGKTNIIGSFPGNASRYGPYVGYTGKILLTFEDNPRKVGVRFDKPIPGGINLGDLCEDNHGFFIDVNELKHETEPHLEENSDSLIIETLFSTLNKEENQPCVVFIRNFEKTVLYHYERYSYFKKELDKLDSRIVFIASSINLAHHKEKSDRPSFLLSSKSGPGNHTALLDLSFLDQLSRMDDRNEPNKSTTKLVAKLFPCKICTYPPKNKTQLAEWQKNIERDRQKMKNDANILMLRKVLSKNSLSCLNMDIMNLKNKVYSRTQIEKVVGWALSEHLINTKSEDLHIEGETLIIDAKAILNSFKMLQDSNPPKVRAITDIETDNDFEKQLLSDVIPPNELKLSFDSIGALDKVKETLKELVMLPLQRPELFRKGNLTKPCKGILLFGPPGTGKTMLAKAVATESGANFISISMASIGSKWFGEGEKYARAVFTLASKIAPCVIFIDEVDCILGRREKHGEHEAMRKIKNEFMMMWDGLKTRPNERVLVLGATNRPFDLDDAVLRRLPRRLLVDLPDLENRIKILKVILKDEDLDSSVDLRELAKITEGFSGSDINNLCIAAAYQPIREFLKSEKQSEKVKECVKIDDMNIESDIDKEERETPNLRQLTMSDFEKAKKDISASVSEDAHIIVELRKWNDQYGEGGNRKKSTLPYLIYL